MTTKRMCDSCDRNPATITVVFDDDTTFELCSTCVSVGTGRVVELVGAP